MRATSEQIRLANSSEQAESEMRDDPSWQRFLPLAFKDPGVEICCDLAVAFGPSQPTPKSPRSPTDGVRQRMACASGGLAISSLRPTPYLTIMVHAHADRHDAHARKMEVPMTTGLHRCRALVRDRVHAGSRSTGRRRPAGQIFACTRGCLPQFVSSRTLQRPCATDGLIINSISIARTARARRDTCC